jgi:dUTP pyrophosphatase
MQDNLLITALNKYPQLMVLSIYLSIQDKSLLQQYQDAINAHNNKVLVDSYPDAGFDIFVVNDILTLPGKLNYIDFGLKCSAKMYYDFGSTSTNTGFYMYPRSSLSKTNLRLANSVGIIDSGYRGNLIGAFDCSSLSDPLFNTAPGGSKLSQNFVKKYNRLTQICAPGLVPIFVILVDSESDLGSETTRGDGGFGSTNHI